jgi:hypothetical protein
MMLLSNLSWLMVNARHRRADINRGLRRLEIWHHTKHDYYNIWIRSLLDPHNPTQQFNAVDALTAQSVLAHFNNGGYDASPPSLTPQEDQGH